MIIKKTNGQHAFIYFFDLLSRTNTWKVTTHKVVCSNKYSNWIARFCDFFVRKFRYISISDREKQKQTNVQKEEEKNAIIFESSVVILKNKITGFIF